tara:strand:+ start:2033 stop:2563 length:531 start_codon:yes stop_codon:yes gene_type:complete
MAAFTVIDHTELTGDTASWTKSSIPASYDHLYLVASIRSSRANAEEQHYINVNGSTDANDYSTTRLNNEGSSVYSGRYSTGGIAYWGYFHMPAAVALADTFGALTMWIPNYANTANFKQAFISASSEDASTSFAVRNSVNACLFHSTAAVDQITVTPLYASMVQYSTFTLYGVTGA